MKTFSFIVYITPPIFDDEIVADRLYEAGATDCLYACVNGQYEVSFDREASCFSEALHTALDNLKDSGIGSDILRVYNENILQSKSENFLVV